MKNPKTILMVIVALLLACGGLSMCVSNTAHQSRDVLDSASLYRSIGVLDKQVSVIDKLTTVLTVQNVIIIAVVIFILVICAVILRRAPGHGGGGGTQYQPTQMMTQNQQSLPLSLPSYQQVMALPAGQRRKLLVDVRRLENELSSSLGDKMTTIINVDGNGRRWS